MYMYVHVHARRPCVAWTGFASVRIRIQIHRIRSRWMRVKFGKFYTLAKVLRTKQIQKHSVLIFFVTLEI